MLILQLRSGERGVPIGMFPRWSFVLIPAVGNGQTKIVVIMFMHRRLGIFASALSAILYPLCWDYYKWYFEWAASLSSFWRISLFPLHFIAIGLVAFCLTVIPVIILNTFFKAIIWVIWKQVAQTLMIFSTAVLMISPKYTYVAFTMLMAGVITNMTANNAMKSEN